MSGPSGGAGGSYAPDYPHDYPPASSSYSPGPVRPMGFVDGEEQQAQRMPTPPPGYPDPSTPAGGYGQGVAEQATVSTNYPSSHSGGSTLRRTPSTASLPPTPEIYYTPAQSGGRTLGRSNSATSLSPASEVYYTPAQTGRLTPGRKPLPPSLLPAPEVYYTPVQTGCPMLGRTQSETSLSPTPEVYYTPSQAGGPTLGRTPSAAPLSPVPGGSSHAGSIPVLPLSASPAGYPSGAYLPYTPPPPVSTQYLYGSGNGYSTSGRCRSARADPVTGTPYPSTTPSGAPGRDAVCYGTPAGYYGGSAPGTSCYPPGRASELESSYVMKFRLAPSMEGTIKTHMNFNVERDVEALKKAMGGWTTDHAAIIDIVCARSAHQRQEIVRVYKQSFGRDIVDDAKSALRGNLEDVVVGLLYPVHEYLARELHRAIAGLGTDEECLIEILCTHSNEDIRLIKDHYQRIFKKDLEKDIIGDTSGDFRRLLVSMCNQLQKAGVLRWGTDVSAFNRIIATQSYEQLRLVFREYNALANHTVMEAIKSEMSGDLRKGFLAIVKCVYSPPFYFAETLYYAMKGLGTNDRVLKRVVLSRCEKDLELIKQEYEDKYKVTLASAIQSDTSGNYRKALLALVHGN